MENNCEVVSERCMNQCIDENKLCICSCKLGVLYKYKVRVKSVPNNDESFPFVCHDNQVLPKKLDTCDEKYKGF